MIRSFVVSLLFLNIGISFAADLKVYTDPRSAISAAKSEGKLIVFLLSDSSNNDHRPVAQALNDELGRLENEFVLVNCAHSIKANRDLFSVRFGKDLSKLPIAVVSDAQGGEITAYQGSEGDGYEKMLISARIEGGIIKDPVKLATLKEDLSKVGEKRGFLAPMLEDLKVEKVAITKMRAWTKKDGTVFQAILLEALGDVGVFVDGNGNSSKVKFNDLSAENLQYLQTILQVQKVEN